MSDASPNIKWKLVVGHHPMYTGGSRTEGYDTKAIRNSLKPLLDKYKVDAYINGHEHSLQHIKPAGVTHHFISGAASERTAVKLIPDARMVASTYGFMLFSVTANHMLVQTIDYNGQIIYSSNIAK
ncbi:metallophosphoesterase [Phnomibacter ginsenosidimutans]|uniref:metallophosphoesterase n=1 Tax=Phnomibacter ginsenosidimutans TaxID=2676868 RepID=UPI0018D23BF0|nr:metallophosphoesterase [Phnomibacter ginsenosidimutans]